jgi:tetraacyldisaccharide-1-P 4'-kinase
MALSQNAEVIEIGGNGRTPFVTDLARTAFEGNQTSVIARRAIAPHERAE